jgi:tripartite-type tricarboxylate transporter receptor subunit TctC
MPQENREREEKIMYQSNRKILVVFPAIIAILTLFLGVMNVSAQPKYPTKPIDLIVAYPPAGGADVAGRLIAGYVERKWGQRVNVINKPGGNGIPAILEVLGATPDGYTLMADITTSYTMVHIAMKDLPFKATDRAMLAIWGAQPTVFFVNPSSPYKTLKDVEADAKKDPGNFTWTSLGGPAPQDYVMKQFFREIGVDVAKTKPVVAKGGAQTIVLVAGGHVKFGTSSTSATIPAAKANNVKMMGICLKTKWPDLPDVPTVYEAGYKSITFLPWVGITGPLNLPPHVVAAWNQVIPEMLKDPEMQPKLRNVGIAPYYHNAQEGRALVLKEIEEGSKMWSAK